MSLHWWFSFININVKHNPGFYPRPVLAFGYCHCVRVSINHEFVCAITRHKFELESPNMYQKCKVFCLKSLLFCSYYNCSLAGCYGEWRAPASITSPVWRNPIHRNPFLIINQIHKYTQMTHTVFVTYECTKLLCVALTRFYHDSFSFKENTYPVLNQRHISVDIRTAPFFLPEPITRDHVFQNRSFHSEPPAAYCRKSHSCYRHQGKFFKWASAHAVSVWYLDLHY